MAGWAWWERLRAPAAIEPAAAGLMPAEPAAIESAALVD